MNDQARCNCSQKPNENQPPRLEPGMITWGLYPTHDKGLKWHPALILRVVKDSQSTVVTAVLGTSQRVEEESSPSALPCFSDDSEFHHTGLRTSTRFNMDGLRFKFRPGTCKEAVIGVISEELTPNLFRRLILACKSTAL